MDLQVGDIVARKSYKNDVYFKISEISGTSGNRRAKLRALDVRLMADSPLEDLVRVTGAEIKGYRQQFVSKHNLQMQKRREPQIAKQALRADNFFEMPGRVLHLDGTTEYLSLCQRLYAQLGIKADCLHVPEEQQPAAVPALLDEYTPDILVLTGHDGILKSTSDYKDLANYYNSQYFIEAVRAARKRDVRLDGLIIFAGACQSQYEMLISAGANYASSPNRIFIHAFDPVLIVEKAALTPIDEIIPLDEVVYNTTTGPEGIGGIETLGKYRRGFPKGFLLHEVKDQIHNGR